MILVSLRCSHTQSMDVDVDSHIILDLAASEMSACDFMEAFAHICMDESFQGYS